LQAWFFFGSVDVTAPEEEIEKTVLEHHRAEPSGKEFYDKVYSFTQADYDFASTTLLAGIVPHHLLAGDMIAEFYQNLSKFDYDTVILLGPNHFDSGKGAIITSDLNWQTPFGELTVDKEALLYLSNAEPKIKIEALALEGEHSINSQVAFIKKTFPKAKFLPLILRSNITAFEAEKLSKALSELKNKKKILVLASVDFSHYVDSESAQKHDKKSLSVLKDMDLNLVYGIEVDSPATIYTVMNYAKLNNAGFDLLDNSNSALLSAKPEIKETTSYITGYFREEKISMLFFGDLMLDRYVLDRIKEKGLDNLFSKLEEADFFSGYDLISANLEGAVTDKGAYYPPIKEYDFAFHPDLIDSLKKYNFNFFNLANNHIEDQGVRGIAETRNNLDKLGFNFSGDVTGKVSEYSAKIIEIKNKKIAMLGLSDLWGALDKEAVQKSARDLAPSSDILVVNIHWGEEYEADPNNRQKEMAHLLIDAGADVIIGHHPHVVQTIETYKNKPIFYSLGNFIFDQYFSKETQRSLAVEIIYNGRNVEYLLHPLSVQYESGGIR
jgi:poly-gamma-glutamate synthesis protein (capsule biosynthesis protein)